MQNLKDQTEKWNTHPCRWNLFKKSSYLKKYFKSNLKNVSKTIRKNVLITILKTVKKTCNFSYIFYIIKIVHLSKKLFRILSKNCVTKELSNYFRCMCRKPKNRHLVKRPQDYLVVILILDNIIKKQLIAISCITWRLFHIDKERFCHLSDIFHYLIKYNL